MCESVRIRRALDAHSFAPRVAAARRADLIRQLAEVWLIVEPATMAKLTFQLQTTFLVGQEHSGEICRRRQMTFARAFGLPMFACR